jgi:hypothetical protein
MDGEQVMRAGRLILVLIVMLSGADALAAFTGVRATPRQAQLVGSGDNLISVTWRVSTTGDHTEGVSSPLADIVDPAGRDVLQQVDTTFDAAGAGPFVFRELVRIDAATVRTWAERGITRAVLTRSFGDAAGNSVSGTVVLRLSRSRLQAARDAAPSALSIVALRLEFETGNDTAITTLDESLRATLTVQYTGSGVLHGRWQVAGPESPDSMPVYRTLSIVNTNLTTSQRSTLRSPELPAGRSGRYLVRFCVTNQAEVDLDGDAQCPSAELVSVASYFVQGGNGRSIATIRGLSPNRQAVSSATVFSWSSLNGAHVYQLQVFALAPAEAGLPSSRVENDSVEPRFVTGMLLDSGTHETALSELVRSKLEEGQRYLWRVTAHDETGRMIGTSAEASFVYAPAE